MSDDIDTDADTVTADADADAGRVLYLNFAGERPDKRADTADAKGTDGDWVGVDQFKAYDHDFSGELLGHRYKLEERIGVGHVSTLYRAKDRRLGITVAVKVLHPEHNQNADLMRRFTQEARLASQVRHPNLVPAVDFAGLGMRRFIVFELVKGRTVNDHMFEATFPWRRATEIICDLLAGLSAMHEAGVVHRDISPLNCLVDSANGGRGRLIDFGYVRLLDKRGGLDIAMPPQTKSMMIYGTEGHIEPERLHGGPADERFRGVGVDEGKTGSTRARKRGGRRSWRSASGRADFGPIRDRPCCSYRDCHGVARFAGTCGSQPENPGTPTPLRTPEFLEIGGPCGAGGVRRGAVGQRREGPQATARRRHHPRSTNESVFNDSPPSKPEAPSTLPGRAPP